MRVHELQPARARVFASRLRGIVGQAAETAAAAINRRVYLALEYETSARNGPRWGHGRPAHQQLAGLFERERATYDEVIRHILAHRDALAAIPAAHNVSDSLSPRWNSGNLPGLDGAAIYSLIRWREPSRYLEIGSGNSTRFAARAIGDAGLETRIISVDPHPRAEIDALCQTVIRQPLELVDPAIFADLQAGDIVFFDGSHRAFMNSDVTVFFLDVIPRLAPGVIFGIHDILLPDDYSQATSERYWSEQYVLAAYLLGGHAHARILFPSWFVSQHSTLSDGLNALWDVLPPVERHGDSFWMETT